MVWQKVEAAWQALSPFCADPRRQVALPLNQHRSLQARPLSRPMGSSFSKPEPATWQPIASPSPGIWNSTPWWLSPGSRWAETQASPVSHHTHGMPGFQGSKLNQYRFMERHASLLAVTVDSVPDNARHRHHVQQHSSKRLGGYVITRAYPVLSSHAAPNVQRLAAIAARVPDNI